MKTNDRRTARAAMAGATYAALALAATFQASAQETVTQGSVRAGVGALGGDSADRSIFTQYNGLRTHGLYGLLDFEYVRLDAETGMRTHVLGADLLGETRELSVLWKRQGAWRLRADYDELVRRDPRTIDTGLIGAGTTTPQVVHLPGGPGTGRELDLKTRRKGLGLEYSRWLSPAVELQASLRSENKEGARLFGTGFACPSPIAPGCAPTTGANPGSALLLLPEPIDSTHTQVQARVSYAGDKLRIGTGYYGSFYDNSNGTLRPTVPAALNNPLGVPLPLNTGLQAILNDPVALAPDNRADHFDVAGLYAFTPTTRASFKLGYARARQTQNFLASGLTGAPPGVSNLGGEVTTTLAQLGFASRPISRLSLLGELRYDDRDDRTPIALYNIEGTATYTNRNLPFTKTRGKLQASWQFDSSWRGTLGAEYEGIDRGAFTATSAVSGISALRERTDELGYRAELKRRMSDSFSAGVSVVTSRRDGSSWLRPNSGLGVSTFGSPGVAITSTSIFMPTLADRERDRIRVFGVWQPTDEFTLQVSAEDGTDKYSTPSDQGLRRTGMDLFDIDWSYAFSESWTFNGYVSQGNQTLDQSRPGGYIMAFENRNTSVGVGAVGKPTGRLDLGASVAYFNDRNAYSQTLDPAADLGSVALLSATGGLPDIVFRTIEWRLFGRYKLSGGAALRLDLVHYRAKFDDWAFAFDGVPFVYSDNTTVFRQRSQNVTFVGLTYVYQWQ